MTTNTLSDTAISDSPADFNMTDRSGGPGPTVVNAASLQGKAVVNSTGEKLGSIEAIMLDGSSGRVAYAVLSFGGFLGMGNKLFAMPWSAVTLKGERFLLDVRKELLESAPGFDRDHWPSMADREWAIQLHAYYDEEPYWDDTLSASSG
jgi:sporulation protein YlmC with PRC-barrel domain